MKMSLLVSMAVLSFSSLSSGAESVQKQMPKKLPPKVQAAPQMNVKPLKGAVEKAKVEAVEKIKKAQSTGNTNVMQQNFNEFDVPEIDPVIEDKYMSY